MSGVAPTEPLLVVFIMYLMTGIFFTPLTKLQKSNVRVKKSSWIVIMVYGIALASSTLAFSFGLQETSATNDPF
jgi:hypothetical protein